MVYRTVCTFRRLITVGAMCGFAAAETCIVFGSTGITSETAHSAVVAASGIRVVFSGRTILPANVKIKRQRTEFKEQAVNTVGFENFVSPSLHAVHFRDLLLLKLLKDVGVNVYFL